MSRILCTLVLALLASTTHANDAEQMLAEANRVSGLNRTLDPALCQAAQHYADYLARHQLLGHYCYGTPQYRAQLAGFTGSLDGPRRPNPDGSISYDTGEVLAFGQPDIPTAFGDWLKSTGHCRVVKESSFTLCGFGRCGTVWVGMFGKPKGQ